MALFKKNKKEKSTAKPLIPAEQIHAMPREFKTATVKSAPVKHKTKSSGTITASAVKAKELTKTVFRGIERRVVVIGGAIITLILVIIGGFLLLSQRDRAPIIIEKEVIVERIVSTNQANGQSVSTEEDETAAQAITTVIPPLFEVGVGQAPDADNDDLTAEEEKLYGTGANKPDTDEDGYLDGHEVLHLYDPLKPEPSRLDQSSAVRRYNNPTFHYNVLYPANWLPRALDEADQEVIFTSLTGEFFEVRVQGNPLGLSATDWYDRYLDVKDQVSTMSLETKQGFKGVKTENNQSVYLVYPAEADVLFILTYVRGSSSTLNFNRTFEMFVNSFAIGTMIDSQVKQTLPLEVTPSFTDASLEPLTFDDEEESRGENSDLPMPTTPTPAELLTVEAEAIAAGYRLINLGLTIDGIQPTEVQVLAGEPVRLYFGPVIPLRLLIPALNLSRDVSPNEQTVDLTFDELGVYEFYFTDQTGEALANEFTGTIIAQ